MGHRQSFALGSFARSGTPGADGWLAPPSSSAVGVPRSRVSRARSGTPGADGRLAPPASSAVGVPLVSLARCGTPGADGWLAPPSSSAVGVTRSRVSLARSGTPGADGRLAPPSSSAVGVTRSRAAGWPVAPRSGLSVLVRECHTPDLTTRSSRRRTSADPRTGKAGKARGTQLRGRSLQCHTRRIG